MHGELSIFSGRANPQLAEEICDYLNIPLRGADILDFPNENIFVKLNRSVRQQDVFLVQPASSPVNRNILELLIMIDTLKTKAPFWKQEDTSAGTRWVSDMEDGET